VKPLLRLMCLLLGLVKRDSTSKFTSRSVGRNFFNLLYEIC